MTKTILILFSIACMIGCSTSPVAPDIKGDKDTVYVVSTPTHEAKSLCDLTNTTQDSVKYIYTNGSPDTKVVYIKDAEGCIKRNR